MEKIEYLIGDYTKRIENLQWHIDVNGKFCTADEIARIRERISDFNEFREYLLRL